MRFETRGALRLSCLTDQLQLKGRERPMSCLIWKCQGIMTKLPSKLPSIILALETLHQ
jgi:hypothetical protein